MRIAIIGAGYVGLTTAACLAELGHAVVCCDVDRERIADLSRGRLPYYEPSLAPLLRRGLESGALAFTVSTSACVAQAEAVLLAVGTPSAADGGVDLSQVERAARDLAPHLSPGAVVVIKSTVSVGTARRLRETIAEARRALDFSVASNPEFLREGSAVGDFMQPDRIVLGADDARSADVLRAIYRPLEQQGLPVFVTSCASAEMIKHAANAFLALKIGFINDVSDLCEKTGGDVLAVAEGIGLDRRIGRSFLQPGPGFGGSCFPKDTRAFAATGRRNGAHQPLVETLIARNEDRKLRLARRIVRQARLSRGARVAVLGLAFKAGTDDVRESAAVTIVAALQREGMRVHAHDPRAYDTARPLLPDVQIEETPYAAARGADALVILTEWDDYRSMDFARLAADMRGTTIFDFRNLLPPDTAARYGLTCIRLGRRPEMPAVEAPAQKRAAFPGRSAAAPGHG